MWQRIEKKFLFFVIIAFELVAIICRYYEENTGHLQFNVLKIYTKISHIIEREILQKLLFLR